MGERREHNCCSFRTIALTLLLTASASMASAETYTTRNGGPAQAAMIARGQALSDGLAFYRHVLLGVLYSAGTTGSGRT
jgi:hypothetical protein